MIRNKNYVLFSFVVSILIITSLFLVFGFSDKPFYETKADKKISSEIYEKVEKGGNVRVFIKFKDDVVSAKGISSTNEGIKEVKDGIAKNKIKHDFGNVISAFLDEDDLKRFEKDDRVEKIVLEPIRQIYLQNSVPLINGTSTWQLQQNFLNLTGSGQAICIIDTGINYSHSDLGGCYGNNSASSSCKIVGGLDYCSDNVDCSEWDYYPDDVNGHGTHVAGTAAANGSIKGVAQGARIIMFKACNSTGSCADSDIKAGIDLCIQNASVFNISVISISIGGGTYTSYCDNQDDPTNITSSINNATGRNISVIIASGNDGSSSAVSWPACMKNATSVSSTDKSDAISSFSNRYQYMSLFAPGGASTGLGSCTAGSSDANRICSTYFDGQYASMSGTSMAAPHVAGAVAIIRQYLTLTGQIRTPKQIENILNSTGKIITDSATGIRYSRIDVYSAIISLDNSSPNVTLISPSSGNVSLNRNQTFRCNATDMSLKNMTFYLWNSSSAYNQTYQIVSGAVNRFEINISDVASGDYNWNCLYTDENNNRALASSNYSLIITNGINVSLLSPTNNLFTIQNQTFSCNASAIYLNNSLTNVTFYIWNSSVLMYNSSINISGLVNGTIFYYNFTNEGSFNWNCLFMNNVTSQSFASSNYSITYDVSPPNLSIGSPINGSWYNAARLNISLIENGTCLYSLNNGVSNATMNTSDNRNFGAVNSTLLQNGLYNVTFYCNDSAGNRNSSSVINFYTDLTKPNATVFEPFPADETASSASKIFHYNVSDNLNISSCSLILNGAINLTNSSISNQSINYNFTQTLISGAYTWNINCTDIAGNIGNSSSRSFTITAPATPQSGSSGGGGGGGGGAGSISKTYSVEENQLQTGYSNELSKGEKIKFTLLSENHTLTLNSTNSSAARIIITSKPIDITLSVGQSLKLSLVSPEYYDISIKLEGISNNKANITLKIINESISPRPADKNNQNQSKSNPGISNTGEEDNSDHSNSKDILLLTGHILAALMVLSAILIIYRMRKRGKDKNLLRKKKKKYSSKKTRE